ncbi:MAG: PhnD/SsuA/transferrin family substrate-binding protein [Chloroflexota bacterium]
MKRNPLLIIFVFIFIMSCSLPQVTITQPATETPTPAVTPTDTALPPLPKPELGQPENPLILALAPSSNTQAQIDAAKVIAAQLKERTGYTVVTVIPDSYSALVDALEKGNAHIVLLDALSYELAYQKGLVQASFAVVKDGKDTYGAQFIASRKGGFKSYFDAVGQVNTAEASEALAQFADKKPCWTDETSPSGYVLPLGYLNKNQIQTKPAAFVQGHPTVVRSVYLGGICDFGATYVDARKFPSLEDQYPDLMEQVLVVWQIPEIIPYAVLAFSTNMSQPMHDLFSNTVHAIMQTDAGKAAFKTAYDIEELLPVTDADYAEFHEYVGEARLELSTLVK